jgi:hypothetical protein
MLPISLQSAPKILEFVGHTLMKLNNFAPSSSTDFNPSCMRFEERVCLWMLQCAQEIFGATIFVQVTNPA